VELSFNLKVSNVDDLERLLGLAATLFGDSSAFKTLLANTAVGEAAVVQSDSSDGADTLAVGGVSVFSPSEKSDASLVKLGDTTAAEKFVFGG
jgi:hypothetical protein